MPIFQTCVKSQIVSSPLFTKQIDWELIESMLPEVLRVVLSSEPDASSPPRSPGVWQRVHARTNCTLLSGTGLRVRTIFLLEYIACIELRRTIPGSHEQKRGVQSVCAMGGLDGGRLLTENTRDEQRKMIKYHHLIANLLIFHNVVTMTRALHTLIAEGHSIHEEALACFSPTKPNTSIGLAATLSSGTECRSRWSECAFSACHRDPRAGGRRRLRTV